MKRVISRNKFKEYKKPSIVWVLSIVSACLILSCGKAISDAQNFTPNNPPSIAGISVTNVDGSSIEASKILSFAVYNITVTASDPDNQSLSYSFKSVSGSFKNLSVTETGCTVQFVTGSISGGEKVRVAVQAADSHGGAAGSSIDVGTGKLGPSISVSASRDHIKSIADVTLSIRSNCDGIFQICTDPAGTYSENMAINNNDDVMIYNCDVADELVTGPASTTVGGIAHLPSLSGKTAGNYNDTYPVWVVFRDSLKQTTAVKCPIVVDDIKPHAVSWSPASGSTGVSRTPTIAIVFDEDVDPVTLPGSLTVTSTDGDGGVGIPSYDTGSHAARYPVTGLPLSMNMITAHISDVVTDLAGNKLDSANNSIAFSTGENISGAAYWAMTPSEASAASSFIGIAADGSGDIYAVGTIQGTETFNFGGNSSSVNGQSSSSNAVIVRYDASGVCQWAKTLTLAPYESGYNRVFVDGSENVYVVGYVLSSSTPPLPSYNFGNGQGITCRTYGINPVILKYNSSGVCQWAKTLTSVSSTIGGCSLNDVGMDASCVYVVGSIYGQYTYRFDSIEVTGKSDGYNNPFMAKFDSETGVCQWAKTTDIASSHSYFAGFAAGTSGVYAVGVIESTGLYDFGSGSIRGADSSSNSVIVKYNASGVCQWAKTLDAAAGLNIYNGVATDAADNAYAVGSVYGLGTFSFGNGKSFNTSTLGTTNQFNSSIVKYDPSGTCMWVRTAVSATTGNNFLRIVKGTSGLYITGQIIGNGSFGFGSTQSSQVTGRYSGFNAVILKYDVSGICQWATTLVSASNNSTFEDLAVDASGSVYAAGSVQRTDSFNFGGLSPLVTGLDTSSTSVIVKYQQ